MRRKNKNEIPFGGGKLVLLIVLAMLTACSGKKSETSEPAATHQGFSFFDLDANSRYSDSTRDALDQKLGSDAIAHSNTMDLTIRHDLFLKRYFPHLHELNLSLNWPPRERVEHHTTKLMYRYAQKQGVPFRYVELFFSDYTQKPLFFRILAGPDGAPVLDSIKEKYGPPKEIEAQAQEGKIIFWQKDKDVFLVLASKDRYDHPEFTFCIYYVANLEQLLNTEKQERQAKAEKIRKAGKSAF
jgi:hypothetical protein